MRTPAPFFLFRNASFLFLLIPAMILCGPACTAAQRHQSIVSSERIRVLLAENLSSVEITAANGRRVKLAAHSALPRFFPEGKNPILVNGKPYRGSIEVRRLGRASADRGRAPGVAVINHVSLEDYLLGVVPAEMSRRAPQEALKAQAVVARSYVLAILAKRRRSPTVPKEYDLRDGVTDQVYGGKAAEREETSRAVRATRGEVLFHDGEIVPGFFHSSCGGRTATPQEVWGTKSGAGDETTKVFQSVSDTYCEAYPRFFWTTELSRSRMNEKARSHWGLWKVTRLAVLSRGPSGRIRYIRLVGRTRKGAERRFLVSGKDFRRVIGAGEMRSTLADIVPTKTGWLISGNGFGHGVGLCQWGAMGRAEAGFNYREILKHYFPNSSVVRWKGGKKRETP
ncbi:MAG: SpoIID/LytB domain-containing protein [Candidatus Hydrogenedentota bacterium]|nr:MAG: SpoIID/LytB domain-containing protein [Candidatus Hydrogenedentota bacterium]